MQYQVTKQYARDEERACAEFNDLSDAKIFIVAKMEADASLNVKVIYRIFKGMTLIETDDPSQSNAASASEGAQGKGSSASFRPTPLNMTPTPRGLPKKWVVDDQEDDKKK